MSAALHPDVVDAALACASTLVGMEVALVIGIRGEKVRYEHVRGGIESKLRVYVAAGEPLKVYELSLRNASPDPRELSVTLELGSEAPGYNANWPSDIDFHIGGLHVGTWTCPGNFGGTRGQYTPAWWSEQNSQYLRALLLPAIAAISRPATLLTPRLPFQEGNKVSINLNGQELRAILSRRQTSTGSFSQFEYRKLDQQSAPAGSPVTAQERPGKSGEEDFDSLWKSL